jgi:hypothetical protein
MNQPCRLGNQIVIRVADYPHFGKLSNRQFAPHINPSINVRRIRLAASNEVMTRGE